MYLLSICIPSYNRKKDLKRMLNSIDFKQNIEVIVCDDGSTDSTKELINIYKNKTNLKYIFQENSGVSAAMLTAYKNSTGKYLIKMDSDDFFTDDGLMFILKSINDNPKINAFLYGIKTLKRNIQKNNMPPDGITNFISVRADQKIKGDLKEVVKREIVLKYMYKVPKDVKRIPPSLLWVKIAEDYNCLSFKKAVAIKNYLEEGITSKMLYLKTKYPSAMVELYERLSSSKAYRSIVFRWKSRLLWARYSFHNNSIYVKEFWHYLVYFPGWCIYKIDRLILNKKYK